MCRMYVQSAVVGKAFCFIDRGFVFWANFDGITLQGIANTGYFIF